MALIRGITELQKNRQRVQGVVDCSYSVFTWAGDRYIQLDTYGSPDRAIPGKASQVLQFDRTGAEHLLNLIRQTFPDLR